MSKLTDIFMTGRVPPSVNVNQSFIKPMTCWEIADYAFGSQRDDAANYGGNRESIDPTNQAKPYEVVSSVRIDPSDFNAPTQPDPVTFGFPNRVGAAVTLSGFSRRPGLGMMPPEPPPTTSGSRVSGYIMLGIVLLGLGYVALKK